MKRVTILGILPHKSGQQKVCHQFFIIGDGGNMSHVWKRKIMCQATFFKGVIFVSCRVP